MAKEVAKTNNKNKKHFWKDFKAELKKVIWPTPKQLFKNTVAVLFIVIITSAIVFVLDVVFDALNTYGINKLKSAIKDSVSVENVIEEDETNTETLDTEEVNTVVELDTTETDEAEKQ